MGKTLRNSCPTHWTRHFIIYNENTKLNARSSTHYYKGLFWRESKSKNIMDSRLLAFVSVCLFLLTTPVFSAPAADPKPHLEQSKDLPLSKRPKCMDTREPQDIFKELLYLTLQQLVSDGKVNPEVITDSANGVPSKRGYQGLCLRRTANQRYIAYPCWRTGSK